MKRFLKLLKPPVIRKIVYSLVSKIVIALAIILLWDRLLNQKSVHPWGIVDTGFFALSIWFVIGAWIQYLAFDGFRPFHSLRSRKKERSINAWEEEELEEDEEKEDASWRSYLDDEEEDLDLGIPDSEFEDEEEEEEEEEEYAEEEEDFEYVSADDYYDMDDDDEDDDEDDFDSFDDDDAPTPKTKKKKKREDDDF